MNVRTIGCVAAELLEKSHIAVVQGKTRQGIFLRLDLGWVIFLSYKTERGPLTVNIVDEADYLDNIPVGAHLEVATAGNYQVQAIVTSHPLTPGDTLPISRASLVDQAMSTENGNIKSSLVLEVDHLQVWRASPRPTNTLPAGEWTWAAASLIKQALKIRPAASLIALQAAYDESVNEPDGEARLFFPHLARINAQLNDRRRSMNEALRSPLQQLDPHCLSSLLGLGRGLTPTGDDILLGMLLALNRWRSLLAPRYDISMVNREIVRQAYLDSTIISANLIECATRGQADERLITSLDSMMTGFPDPAEAASLLAEWGSTSGLDALCGMALVIKSARRQR